jgi:hypothetical protein
MMDMTQNPTALAVLGVLALLAFIGIWYLITHHWHAIAVAILSAVGTVAGLDVLWQGFQLANRRLMLWGAFVGLVFPLIFYYAVVLAKRAPQETSGAGAPSTRPQGAAGARDARTAGKG